jgi:hypothetical protein
MLREPGAPQKQGTSRDEGPDRASKNRKIIKLMDCGGRVGMLNIPTNLGLNVAGGWTPGNLPHKRRRIIYHISLHKRVGHISDLGMSMNVSKIMHDCHPLDSPKTASFDF